MTGALTYFGYSIAILVILTVLYVTEDRVGRKIIFSRLREAIDRRLVKMCPSKVFFERGFMRLLLHYSAHSALRRLSYLLRKCEKRVALLASRNRAAAKGISAQKQNRTHLDEIADHKSEVALSESEKKKMRSH